MIDNDNIGESPAVRESTLEPDVAAWPRLRFLVRRSWAEEMRGDWRHYAKTQLTEAAGLGDNHCLEIADVRSCREEMEIFEARPTIRGRAGFDLPAIGNWMDVSWYGELAQFREMAFVAELVFSPSAGLSVQEVSQRLEKQLGLCAGRTHASDAFHNLRNLVPRGARHMYLVPLRRRDGVDRRTTITILEENLSEELTDLANIPMKHPITRGIDASETSAVSSYGVSPAPPSWIESSFRSISPGSNVLCLEPGGISPADQTVKLKVESAKIACREAVAVQDVISQQAIVYGREFTNYPRVRIPVRASFFERFGDDWMLALKDFLSNCGGLQQRPSADIEIVAIRSLQDEMLLFEDRPATCCQPHHNAPPTVDREARIPSVARMKDAQWYGQLVYISEPAVVVEIAMAPNISQVDFVQALSAELSRSNFYRSEHRLGMSPLQQSTEIQGIADAHQPDKRFAHQPDKRFASLRVQDVVPDETRQVYTFPPLLIASSLRPRQVLQQNPCVGRQLRLGVGECSGTSPRAITAPSAPVTRRRPALSAYKRHLGTTGVKVWQGPAGICTSPPRAWGATM